MNSESSSQHNIQHHKARFNADIDSVTSTVIYDGKRLRRELKYGVVNNRHTGEHHHDYVTIQTFRKVGAGWEFHPKQSITLSDDKNNELTKALQTISACREKVIDSEGNFLLFNTSQMEEQQKQLLRSVVRLNSNEQIEILLKIIKEFRFSNQMAQLVTAIELADDRELEVTALLLNIATYRKSLTKFLKLIKEPGTTEHQFQKLFEEHPWIFGSEYSQPLDMRKLSRDEQQDFIMRKSTDGYLEIIEIKTPLPETKSLFLYDSSHDSWYPCADLSKVIGQVQNYIEKSDNERAVNYLRDKNIDALRIRARVVIGHTRNDEDQKRALRVFNSHLNRIEVITFDQLANLARQTLEFMQKKAKADWQGEHPQDAEFSPNGRPPIEDENFAEDGL